MNFPKIAICVKLCESIFNFSHLLIRGLIEGLKGIGDFLVFWQKESFIELLLIAENSKADYTKVLLNSNRLVLDAL